MSVQRAVRQVHAHRRPLVQNRECDRPVRLGGAIRDADRSGWSAAVAEPEHPAIAAHFADAAADLIGERLKGQSAIRRRQGARQGVAWPVRRLLGQEELYRFIEAAQQQTAIALERHSAARRQIGTERQMVAVDRGEKEQGAHALVEVAGFLTKNVQIGTFVE